MKKYDERHGGPFDRGSADRWFLRDFNPHYFKGYTSIPSEAVLLKDMNKEQVEAYTAGYNSYGDHKVY